MKGCDNRSQQETGLEIIVGGFILSFASQAIKENLKSQPELVVAVQVVGSTGVYRE